MAAYDIRELQTHLLDILVAIDQTCRAHNLTYYLTAGTMLGAVRHKGCIPWDDDMDIAMPREDYDTLVRHAREWLPEPFEFKCAENEPDFPSEFGKIIDASTTLVEREHHSYVGGIYVDVFPIDKMTGNTMAQRLHFMSYKFYKKMVYILCRNPYKHGHGVSSWWPLMARRIFSLPDVLRKLLALQTAYAKLDTPLVVDHDDGRGGIMPAEYLGKPTPITFEGRTFMGYEHPDKYLTHKYGDYMTIPNVEHQRQHNFYFLDYNMPYREYVDTREFVRKKK